MPEADDAMADAVLEGELVIAPPEERAPLDLQRAELLAEPKITAIASPEDWTRAHTWRERYLAFRKDARSTWDRWVNVFYLRHKAACDHRTLFFRDGDAREDEYFNLMAAWKREQERKTREAELAIIEQRQKEDRARQLREAKVLDKAGHTDLAAAVRNTPPPPSAPVNLPSGVPSSGPRIRKVWKGRPAFGALTDPEALKKAAQLLPRQYVVPDVKALNDLATATKGTVKVPGWVFYEEDQK